MYGFIDCLWSNERNACILNNANWFDGFTYNNQFIVYHLNLLTGRRDETNSCLSSYERETTLKPLCYCSIFSWDQAHSPAAMLLQSLPFVYHNSIWNRSLE